MSARPSLWAPWRAQYVKGPKPERCIFCEPDPARDRKRGVLYRGERIFVILNRYPYAVGHLMVAPYDHVARLNELSDEAQQELTRTLALCERVLEATLEPDGLNVGANLGSAAGAGFAGHLHLHVVPRWKGDTNFMTVVGETRVISADLDETYERLAPRFAEIRSG